MNAPPKLVDGARVLAYTPIDSRHVTSGRTKHLVGGVPAPRPHALAIARYDDAHGVYLFACDQAWKTVTDTWHQSIDDAKAQAEFEHAGTVNTWIDCDP